MRRALALLLLIAAPSALAQNVEVSKGLANLGRMFMLAQRLEIARALGTLFVGTDATIDPWGTPYVIETERGLIAGAGSDRKFDRDTWTIREQFTTLEGDVVFTNGNFVRTNHNWLAAQRTPADAAALDALRKAEAALLLARTEAMRKTFGSVITAELIEGLGKDLARDRAANREMQDAWGTPLRVALDGETIRIVSAGADRTFQPETWGKPPAQDPAEDIVFENGRFTRRINEQALFMSLSKTAEPIPQPPDRALRDDPNTPFMRIDKTIAAPVVVERVEPAYPEAYRRAHISGIVILELAVRETGEVANYAVLKSLGPALDMAALDAVKKWTFKPATRDGQPIPVLFMLTINFKLN